MKGREKRREKEKLNRKENKKMEGKKRRGMEGGGRRLQERDKEKGKRGRGSREGNRVSTDQVTHLEAADSAKHTGSNCINIWYLGVVN